MFFDTAYVVCLGSSSYKHSLFSMLTFSHLLYTCSYIILTCRTIVIVSCVDNDYVSVWVVIMGLSVLYHYL